MKICVMGSAPSSCRLAPFSDPEFQIWGCSPALYPIVPRVDAWFELHKYEPGIVGKPETQKPWFSPEYCAWMAQQKLVWMQNPVPEIPNSKALDYKNLTQRYGSYFFTSSLAWMMAVAIDAIQADRQHRHDHGIDNVQDVIALYGVDMAANEEYGDQRPGCQFFIQLAIAAGIQVIVPPESDLMAPPMLYGIGESDHMMIKLTERRRELDQRLHVIRTNLETLKRDEMFIAGALDDLNYVMKTWVNAEPAFGANFRKIMEQPKAKVARLHEAAGE